MAMPFYEVHELYRLLFIRSQAQAKEREEREKEESKDKPPYEKRTFGGGIAPSYNNHKKPTDVNKPIETDSLTPFEAEQLQDALEEIME